MVPSSTYFPYRMESTLFRTEARYESSSTSPNWKTTRPRSTTIRPVVLELSRTNSQAFWQSLARPPVGCEGPAISPNVLPPLSGVDRIPGDLGLGLASDEYAPEDRKEDGCAHESQRRSEH